MICNGIIYRWYSCRETREVVSEWRASGTIYRWYSCREAREAGYINSCKEAKEAGYSCTEVREAEYSSREAEGAGYSHEEAWAGGSPSGSCRRGAQDYVILQPGSGSGCRQTSVPDPHSRMGHSQGGVTGPVRL